MSKKGSGQGRRDLKLVVLRERLQGLAQLRPAVRRDSGTCAQLALCTRSVHSLCAQLALCTRSVHLLYALCARIAPRLSGGRGWLGVWVRHWRQKQVPPAPHSREEGKNKDPKSRAVNWPSDRSGFRRGAQMLRGRAAGAN